MALSLKSKFNSSHIKQIIDRGIQHIDAAILQRLKGVGDRFVNNARANGAYTDVSGDLRSSVGYVILKNGGVVAENFSGKTANGKAKAKEVIDSIKQNYSRGYALIVVAGMHYAAAVESRGKDVLTGSSIIATQELQKAFKK